VRCKAAFCAVDGQLPKLAIKNPTSLAPFMGAKISSHMISLK
jgi:hypothetical protein